MYSAAAQREAAQRGALRTSSSVAALSPRSVQAFERSADSSASMAASAPLSRRARRPYGAAATATSQPDTLRSLPSSSRCTAAVVELDDFQEPISISAGRAGTVRPGLAVTVHFCVRELLTSPVGARGAAAPVAASGVPPKVSAAAPVADSAALAGPGPHESVSFGAAVSVEWTRKNRHNHPSPGGWWADTRDFDPRFLPDADAFPVLRKSETAPPSERDLLCAPAASASLCAAGVGGGDEDRPNEIISVRARSVGHPVARPAALPAAAGAARTASPPGTLSRGKKSQQTKERGIRYLPLPTSVDIDFHAYRMMVASSSDSDFEENNESTDENEDLKPGGLFDSD